jgi:hypothetical protein
MEMPPRTTISRIAAAMKLQAGHLPVMRISHRAITNAMH